ncbi:MAG: helix-turn-helix domain-containing protein [Prevotella sp.]|jgi:transcriptional regulator with XRE-family HTH domain|nr:helix-turn-helix domain-containing protein [Prevotella sp.]
MDTAVKKTNHGANVRRWRDWRDVNQDVLAERIGVSQATLSLYEKKETLEPEILDKIAKALDIPVEAITEFDPGTYINIYSGTWKDNAITNQYTFNPIEKIVQLYDEKIALYERMLKEKDEAISLLHDVLKDRK